MELNEHALELTKRSILITLLRSKKHATNDAVMRESRLMAADELERLYKLEDTLIKEVTLRR